MGLAESGTAVECQRVVHASGVLRHLQSRTERNLIAFTLHKLAEGIVWKQTAGQFIDAGFWLVGSSRAGAGFGQFNSVISIHAQLIQYCLDGG